MEKEFVPYPLALRLKALGFDNVPCLAVWYGMPELSDDDYEFFDFHNHFTTNAHYETQYYAQKGYKDGVLAPTFSQVFRFFRENHGLDYEIPYAGRPGEYYAFVKEYVYGNNGNNPSVFTYESAEKVCLEKLIEIVESEKIKK